MDKRGGGPKVKNLRTSYKYGPYSSRADLDCAVSVSVSECSWPLLPREIFMSGALTEENREEFGKRIDKVGKEGKI